MNKVKDVYRRIPRIPKLPYLLIVLVIVALSGIFGYRHFHIAHVVIAKNNLNSKHQSSPSQPPQTHPAQSNGQTFPVPDNVPAGSIKNYTLITENENYMIQELDGAYKITLYPIINNPSESASYQQELHDYKQAALQYMTQHGINVKKVSITYDPPEAAQD